MRKQIPIRRMAIAAAILTTALATAKGSLANAASAKMEAAPSTADQADLTKTHRRHRVTAGSGR